MQLATTYFADNLILHYHPKDSVIGGQIATSGIYEPYEEKLLGSFLEAGDIAVDIGANIGVYTLQMAAKVGQKGRVYAFEPEPTNFSILQKNVRDNHFPQVRLFPLALSNKSTAAKLYLSWDNMGDHRIYDGEYLRPRRSIDIMVSTLDTVLIKEKREERKIIVMKIDTQGYEPFVIQGAKEIIERDHPTIFLEYWPIAYKKASADGKRMIDFLLSEYTRAYVIDGFGERLLPLHLTTLDNFINKSGEEHAWRNLLFTNS